MQKRNYVFIDLLRGICFLAVFLCHFVTAASPLGLTLLAGPGLTNVTEDILGGSGIAVCVFFMVSGFCLMQKEGKVDLRIFYGKRFLRLLLPLYFVLAGFLFLSLVSGHGSSEVIAPDAPWYLVFRSLLGLDGLYHVWGHQTFTLVYAGEWFIGILTALYLIAPLLIRCMQKRSHLMMGILTLLTVLLFVMRPFGEVNAALLFPNLFLFVLGMYLSVHFDRIRLIHALPVFSGGLFFLVLACIQVSRGDPQYFVRLPKVMFLGMSVFVLFLLTEKRLSGRKKLAKRLKPVRTYSYEFFLLHHGILNRVIVFFADRSGGVLNAGGILISLFLSFAITASGAVVLHILCSFTEKLLFRRRKS